jgi:hypothetical protein
MGYPADALRGAGLLVSTLLLAADAAGATPSFERDARPILAAHCLNCHGERSRNAGLDLRSPASIRPGSSDGPVIVPGAATRSTFIEQTISGIMPSGKAVKLAPAEVRC